MLRLLTDNKRINGVTQFKGPITHGKDTIPARINVFNEVIRLLLIGKYIRLHGVKLVFLKLIEFLPPLAGSHNVDGYIMNLTDRPFFPPELQLIDKIFCIIGLPFKCLRISAVYQLFGNQIDDMPCTAKATMIRVKAELFR